MYPYMNNNAILKILFNVCTLCIIIPIRGQIYSQNYACHVPNCQVCSFVNFCGLCQNNYLLQYNSTNSLTYCTPIQCIPANCQTCYTNNQCSVCASGYYVSPDGLCMLGNSPTTCGYKCLSCNTTSCLLCQYGYQLLNGHCFPIGGVYLPNCQSSFTAIFCQLCNTGYIVSPSYSCISNPNNTCNLLSNCALCRTKMLNSQLICIQCLPGYQLNLETCSPKTCNITNCAFCTDRECTLCQQQFSLINNACIIHTYSCNIANCVLCVSADICTACILGYYPQQIFQNNTKISSQCVPYTSNQITNCQILGPMIPGTTLLKIGCIKCQQNFIYVGGYCVANLTLSSYTCNISNCLYCVQNNICGKCIQGYNVYIGSTNQCTKIYTTVKNCQVGALVGCVQCFQGYVLVGNSYCISNDSIITCKIQGCSYCVINNTCAECMQGYNKTSNSCQPLCQTKNCYECNSKSNCVVCNLNYYLNGTQCVPSDNQTSLYCKLLDIHCTDCNYYNCTACSTGYTLFGGSCCPTPAQYNVANCTQYSTKFYPDCSSNVTCTQCQQGSLLINTYNPYGIVPVCVWLSCNLNISNCAYCYLSSVCKICQTGFYLSNNTCISYNVTQCNVPNCVQCNSSPQQCTSCLQGYLLYNGSCVCSFQNCLSCLGSISCTKCAYPTISSITSSTGCLPQGVLFSQCNIQNCLLCMQLNFCSQCAVGFTLLPNGTCYQNVCNRINNCILCNLQQSFCYNCLPGYFQTKNLSPGCSPIPNNYSCQVLYCSLCQVNNPNTCSVCAVFYVKNGVQCVPINCIQNCVFCLALSTCVICQTGFYLTSDNLCAIANTPAIQCPIIPNCVGCQLVEGTLIAVCIQCLLGMQPSSDGQSCIPQNCTIPNCLACDYQYSYKKAPLCLVCNQGYYLNSYFQCTADNSLSPIPNCSNIYNCIFCSYDNYCVFCMLGWLPVNGRCVTNQSSLCLVSNCLACTTGKNCIKCSTNYTLSSNNSTCSLNCNITNCAICVTQNFCQSCMNNMVVISGTTCGCTDNSFLIVQSTCVCQQLYTPNPANLTCIFCDIQYCFSCATENQCAICLNNLYLYQNTCICADNTFQIVNNTCICPINTTLYNNATCIGCSVQYCLNCSSPNICLICINNLTFIGDNICGCGNLQNLVNGQYCVYCQVEYCVQCEGNNFCSQCENSQLAVSSSGQCVCSVSSKTYFNNTCVECSISNCILCQQTNICSQCSPNYYGPTQNICILCNIPSCQKCVSPNYCISCLNNLSVSSQGNLCVTCTIANCTLCSIDDTCAVCYPGFQLISPRLCVLCVLEGCDLCSQDNVCQVCQPSYTLTSSFTCTICIAPCATCAANSSAVCETCVSPFSSQALNNVCFNCYIPFCEQCSPFSLNLCKVCIPNYSLNSSGYCLYSGSCSINCISCLYDQICQQCGPGYTISSLNQTQCLLCNVTNCYTCSPSDLTTCFDCISGYYQSNGLCIACPFINCQTCNSTSCITYQPSTYQSPITYNNIQYAFMCDPGCATCSSINPLSCIVCNQGFTLNQYRICTPCNYPCLQCLPSNTSICISCYNNFYLNDTTCVQGSYSSNCLTFSNQNTSLCISCPFGSMLDNKTNTCSITCPLYCVSCSSQTQCMICIDGYSAGLDGACLPCVSNCRKCAQSFQSVCLDCGIGFYLSNNTCVVCPQFCLSCNLMSCVTCLNGYFLNNQSKCISNCVSPCATCLQNSTTTCKSCLFGYTPTQNGSSVICAPQTSCDGGCQYCPLGYTYSNSSYATCVNCFKNSNCSRCYSTNLTACVSCLNGYYLVIASSLCRICPDSCSSCTSPNNCLTCSSGYTLQGQSVLVPGICIKCSQPCSQCYINSYTCTACISGFILNGWSCQSIFNFGFIMSVNATSQCFYQNYGAILANLTTQVNTTNIQAITISSLSVLVGVITNQTITIIGNISTIQSQGSLTAYTQYISLSTLYTPDTIVNNMTILTYQTQINNGEVYAPKVQNTLAIILGVCIPLLIIIIILIIYIFYVRKKKQTQDKSLTQQFTKIATKQSKYTPRQSQMSVYASKIQEEISPISAKS